MSLWHYKAVVTCRLYSSPNKNFSQTLKILIILNLTFGKSVKVPFKELKYRRCICDPYLQFLCEIIKLFFHVNFDVNLFQKMSHQVLTSQCVNLFQKMILIINRLRVQKSFCSFLTSYYCNYSFLTADVCTPANDETTSQTVSRYFVPYKIQIAEFPPYHTIGFIFWPLFARFLKESWMDNFQRWYNTTIICLCFFFLEVKVPNEFLFIRRYFRSSI